MTDEKWWQEVRDCAVAIAADRMRRGVLTAREITDALDEAYRQGHRAALAPVIDVIGWWETDGTADRKAAAERIRGVIEAASTDEGRAAARALYEHVRRNKTEESAT